MPGPLNVIGGNKITSFHTRCRKGMSRSHKMQCQVLHSKKR